MTAYVTRRLILLPLIIFGVTLLIFVMLTRLSPSQRVALYVSDNAKTDAASMDRLIEEYGLNDPIPQQYARWVKQVAGGNLGFSKTGKEPVADVIRNRLPASVELALWGMIPVLFVGIQLGVLAALRHNRATDHILRIFSIVGTSTPSFVAGLLLLMYFAAHLGWFPTGERLTIANQRFVDSGAWTSATGLYTVDALINGRLDIFRDALWHLILPIITLSYISWATLLRVTRSSMLETLRQDYVRTAHAKGLAHRWVIQKHALPNAMLPVATLGGALLVGLVNGVPITETIFNRAGLGKAAIDAAVNLDIVAVLGFTMFSACLIIVGNLLVDMTYSVLDPRVRLN